MAKKTRVHINADLIQVVRNGRSTFVLLCEDRLLAEFFDNWAYQLAKKSPFNTVKSYCSDVRLIIDFVLEMAKLLGGLTALVLANALDCFEDFLVFGERSDDEHVRHIAKLMRSKTVGGDTASRYIVSANTFLDSNESFRIGMIELEELGYVSPSRMSAFPQSVTFDANASVAVRNALKQNSWLAGCLAGGAKKIKYKGLVPKSKKSLIAYMDEDGGDEDAFPIDKLEELIESATCARDATLWSLGGAIGTRISELLTLQKQDILPGVGGGNGKVLIVDPRTRLAELSRWLAASDVNMLSHKGRTSLDTFMIEPFASHFWIHYNEYHNEIVEFERKNPFLPRHNFVFRKLADHAPYVKSYQTVYERFRAAAFKVTGRNYSPHSLRHMYGYYLANFCPNPWHPGRFGLDLKMVQKFMGHRSARSTMRYARKDARMLEATISALNSLRMGMGGYSTNSARLRHLENLRAEVELALQEKDA